MTLEDEEPNEDSSEIVYKRGFPIGFPIENSENEVLLNNHVSIKLLHHTQPDLYYGSRIVGFEVVPMSVLHTWEGNVPDTLEKQQSIALTSCPLTSSTAPLKIGTGPTSPKHIVWTYDVTFEVWQNSNNRNS